MELAKVSAAACQGRGGFVLCLALLFLLPWLAFFADLPGDGHDALTLMVMILAMSAGSLVMLLLYGLSRVLLKKGQIAKGFAAALLFLVVVFCIAGTLLGVSAVVAGRPLFALVILVYGASSIWLIERLFALLRLIKG